MVDDDDDVRASALRLVGHHGSWPLGGLSLIGREDADNGIFPEIDLTSADPKRTVSRRHAEVSTLVNEGVVIRDVGSGNGTFVGGHRIGVGGWVSVAPGVEIRCGDICLSLMGSGDPAQSSQKVPTRVSDHVEEANDDEPESPPDITRILKEAEVHRTASDIE